MRELISKVGADRIAFFLFGLFGLLGEAEDLFFPRNLGRIESLGGIGCLAFDWAAMQSRVASLAATYKTGEKALGCLLICSDGLFMMR
jgi:hypothetical protein